MTGEAKADMVDALAVPVDRAGVARNQMHHRLAIGVEPVAWKREGGSIARLEVQHRFEEGSRPFQIMRA